MSSPEVTDVPDSGRLDASRLAVRLRESSTLRHTGRVVRAVGTTVRVTGLPVAIGERCLIRCGDAGPGVLADVVGTDHGEAILVPLDTLHGVAANAPVERVAGAASVAVGDALLGRVVNGFGEPIDHLPVPTGLRRRTIDGTAPDALLRGRIDTPLDTGVRAIDAVLTVGVGQRVGIYAPAGTGKSTLLGMLAREARVDVIVVALVGERGREVREFLEDCINASARSRTIMVVSTSDRPAAERLASARTATAIAEHFRGEGKRVLLLVDSITRVARALREIGLAAGEPPVQAGFTPSVFAELPRLFERAGHDERGSITAFYTVLADGEDDDDPVAEETRSILDGHIVLSRDIAAAGRFPAIDVLASVSRVARALQSGTEREAAETVRAMLAKYRDIEFLLRVGEYRAGQDSLADRAIATRAALDAFLYPGSDPVASGSEVRTALQTLLNTERPTVNSTDTTR